MQNMYQHDCNTGYSKMTKPGRDILTWHSEPPLHWFAARSYCQSKGEDLVDDIIVKHDLHHSTDSSMSGEFWVGLFRISWRANGRSDLSIYHLLFSD